MRIVIINAVYRNMSTGRSYKELHDYVEQSGHDCMIIYGQNKEKDNDAIYVGNLLEHKLHAIKSRLTGKIGGYSTYYTKKIIKLLKEYNPDIVHLGNLHSNFINIPILLEFLGENDIATTITLHDCFFFTGGCTHYTLKGCYKWCCECKECKYYKQFGSWFFEKSNYQFKYKKNGFNNISKLGVVGVSNWIADEAKKSPILNQARYIIRNYNWVNLDVFKPIKIEKEIYKKLNVDNKFVILGVASCWSEEKGLTDFIRLSEIVDKDAIIILVGKMDSDIKLPMNIINISATNDVKELNLYYNIADVFVQLSKEETFGKVVAEALSCGTPAIVYNSTASPELVEDGCGYSVDISEGIEGIWNRINMIMSRGKKTYSVKCRHKAKMYFEKNINCKKYIELWEKLV